MYFIGDSILFDYYKTYLPAIQKYSFPPFTYPLTIPAQSLLIIQADGYTRHTIKNAKYHNLHVVLPLLLLFEKLNTVKILLTGCFGWEYYVQKHGLPKHSSRIAFHQLPIEDFTKLNSKGEPFKYQKVEFGAFIRKCELASIINHEIRSSPSSFGDNFTLRQYEQLINKISQI